MIDLRSDTITPPTPAMRQAIASAEVGDDVLGDDPSVLELERRTAEILAKEAAVFVPSGSMANQLAIRVHTQPGDEILVDRNAHIYYYESGGPAALSVVMCQLLPGVRGVFTGDDVLNALRPSNEHFPTTRLLCVENTHNRGGGRVWPLAATQEVAAVAARHDLRMHLDGARLWNAAAASGVTEQELAAPFDSVSVCFSKGLGAPVGSVLAGSAEFIVQARRFRKQFGGAMRQSGLLAAGALHALDHHRSRLAEDHQNARRLAEGLAEIPRISVDPADVETNIVFFRVDRPAKKFVRSLEGEGVQVFDDGPDLIRAVTNLTVDAAQIDRVVAAVARIASP